MLGPCLVYMPKKCCLLVVVAHVSLVLFNRQKNQYFFYSTAKYGQLKLHLVHQPELLFLFQQSLPPVRNQSRRKKKKKKESSTFSNNASKPKDKTRISSYDYRSWDKFDVVSM